MESIFPLGRRFLQDTLSWAHNVLCPGQQSEQWRIFFHQWERNFANSLTFQISSKLSVVALFKERLMSCCSSWQRSDVLWLFTLGRNNIPSPEPHHMPANSTNLTKAKHCKQLQSHTAEASFFWQPLQFWGSCVVKIPVCHTYFLWLGSRDDKTPRVVSHWMSARPPQLVAWHSLTGPVTSSR